MSSFLRAKQCKLKEDSRHISTTDGEIWIHAVRLAYSYPYLLTVADDGTLTLRLRMPDCLAEEYGKYLVIEGVRFAYGHGQVLAALASNAEYAAYRREHGEKTARATALGQAISYRFKRDGKGWRVFATTELPEVAITTDRRRGAIGVDPNADHLAVADTDASGNYLNAWRVPLVTYGKNTQPGGGPHRRRGGQRRAVRHEKLANPSSSRSWTSARRRPLWKGESRRYSRMLSSFNYGKIKAYFLSRGYRQGVESPSGQPGVQFRSWAG